MSAKLSRRITRGIVEGKLSAGNDHLRPVDNIARQRVVRVLLSRVVWVHLDPCKGRHGQDVDIVVARCIVWHAQTTIEVTILSMLAFFLS
jgi:hypothetical protein